MAHIAGCLGPQAAAQHVDAVIGAELLSHQPHYELRCLAADSPGVLHSRVVPANMGGDTLDMDQESNVYHGDSASGCQSIVNIL